MDQHKTEREKLLSIKKHFEQAVATNNIEAMREYIDADFSFVSFTDRAFNDFDSFCARWKKTHDEIVGQGDFSTTLMPEPTLFFNDIAIAYGNSENHMQDRKGKRFQYNSHWTVIFKKDGDNWKVLRGHNSLDPFGNPMLQAGIKQAVMKYSTLAFAAGVLISALVFWLL